LLHMRSSQRFDALSSDVQNITLPQQARITKKLGKGNWRAVDAADGSTFEFSESSAQFVNAGADWPKVGAPLTYHVHAGAGGPAERFAIMVQQKPYMLVSTGHFNMGLAHNAPIPTPEQLEEMDGKAMRAHEASHNGVRAIAGAFAQLALFAAAPFLVAVGRKTGLISKRFDDHAPGFYLPDGYGRKNQPAP